MDNLLSRLLLTYIKKQINVNFNDEVEIVIKNITMHLFTSSNASNYL